MKRVLVTELQSKSEQKVLLRGWAYRIRKLSNIHFIILRDRTGFVQITLDPLLTKDASLSAESVVEVIGYVQEESRAPGGYEVAACELKVISPASLLPFNVNTPQLNAGLDIMLDNRVLSLRHPRQQAIFKIQAALVHGFQQFLNSLGFIQVFTPKIVAAGAEGGTELFALDYFETKAYLAQSPQFYKQMMVGAGYERVYEIGQVYRAEKHATARHLNEYVSLDLELGFIESEHDLMDLQNKLLAAMLKYVETNCTAELELLGIRLPQVPEIPRITLFEALALLEKEYGKMHQIPDLDPEGERLLSNYFWEQEGTDFVFVTDYPWERRPMYTMPKEGSVTRSFDLLFRGMEITTGGQRIHQLDVLEKNFRRKGLNSDNFDFYLKNFAIGMPPHGGLAIGLERLTARLLHLGNIREAALFPRDRHRLVP